MFMLNVYMAVNLEGGLMKEKKRPARPTKPQPQQRQGRGRKKVQSSYLRGVQHTRVDELLGERHTCSPDMVH